MSTFTRTGLRSPARARACTASVWVAENSPARARRGHTQPQAQPAARPGGQRREEMRKPEQRRWLTSKASSQSDDRHAVRCVPHTCSLVSCVKPCSGLP